MRISDWSSDVCSSDLDCRRGAVVGRAVAPTAADLQDMQDARDHPPIVHPAGTGLVLRQVRLDRCPRLIRQPEQRHAMPPIIHAERESGKPIRIKPLIEVWTLAAVVDNIVVGFWRCGSTASCPA